MNPPGLGRHYLGGPHRPSLEYRQHLVDHPVFLGLSGREELVPLNVAPDDFLVLAGVPGEDNFHRGAHPEDLPARIRLAATLLEKAEALASSDAARIALAGAYRDLQRLARAETIYRSILRRRENRAAQVGLAAVLRDKGELYEAESLCREVLKRYPGDQHAQQTLWAIQADMRKPAWRR